MNSQTFTVTAFSGNPVIDSASASGTSTNFGAWFTVNGTGFLTEDAAGNLVWPKLYVNGQQAWVYYAGDNIIKAYLFAWTPSSGSLYVDADGQASNAVSFSIP